jgi:hypothetical protein
MRATLPPETLFAIRLSTWHALFAACGFPAPSALALQSHAAIVAALAAVDLPLPLARAIFTIGHFATDAARSELYAAATALSYPTTRWADATSPADLIASLLAAAPTDDAVAEVVAAAQILRDRSFRPRATQVYFGAPGVDPHIGDAAQYEDRFRAGVSAWCATFGFGAVREVSSRVVAGVYHYEIVHEDRATTHLVADGKASALAARVSRPLRSHAITYEPSQRGLTLTTDSMEAMTPLATIVGRVLFDSPRHFLDAEAVDLWKLQELGPEALAVPELAPTLTVRAIGGTWHSGKSHAITPRGRDFFKALARYKIRIEGGRLDLVTLRARVDAHDGGPASCDVVLRPPHLLTVSEPERAPLMHDLLDRVRLTRPEPRVRDFFSLQPWIDSRAGWIVSGVTLETDFDALVATGLLKADRTNRSVAPPNHPHAGRTATAFPLRGDKFLAWSQDATIAPFLVSAEDLVVYALSFAKLSERIAGALGLEGAAAKLDDDGVLFCGRRALGPTHVLLFLLTRPIRPATTERLREAAEHGHAILILPAGRMAPSGLRQLAMPKLAGPWQPLVGAIVRGLRLESKVDTTLYAPEWARVVLHRATERAWIDGVFCAALHEAHFRLLEILITSDSGLAYTKDIAAHITRGNPTADTTRKAIESLVAAIEKSFKAANEKMPKELREIVTMPRHGYYRLNVRGFVD